MKKALILVLIGLSCLSLIFSQESIKVGNMRSVNQSTLIGLGRSYLYDSYLSPLTYEGIAISLMHDRIKGSTLSNGELLIQNQFRLQTGVTKNPTSSSSEYWGNLYYNLYGYWPLLKNNIGNDKFRFYGGGGPELALGGIYNVRNSNNPGSLKSHINLNVSAIAIYSWRYLTFRWQISSPLGGIFFSPEYGHSYYEIFTLGNDKGTIHLGSFHNQLSLRNYFTVDIPINNLTIRTGYLWDYYSSDVNKLITKISSHQFLIGLAFESLNFGYKKARNNHVLESVYYK